MSFQRTYRPLVSLQIGHGYYHHPSSLDRNRLTPEQQRDRLDEVNSSLFGPPTPAYFGLRPGVDTLKTLSNYKVRYKVFPTGFNMAIQAEEIRPNAWRPYVSLALPVKFTFLLTASVPEFFSFTEIAATAGNEQVYYFSNERENISGDTLYLNSRSPYSSTEDLIELHGPQLSVSVRGMGISSAELEVSNLFADSIQSFSTQPGEPPLRECLLTLNALPEGKYRLQGRNRETGDVFVDKEFFLYKGSFAAKPIGVIEWLVDASIPRRYRLLLPGSQQLVSPTFTLWWQNRMTRWRYILNEEIRVRPDPRCDVVFAPRSRRVLLSRVPQPLIRGTRPICFRQDVPGSPRNEEIYLPNPGVTNIYPESDGNVYSEMYLGPLDFNNT